MITKFILFTALTMAGKILSTVVFLLTILASYAGYVNPAIWAFPSVLTLTLPYVASLTILLTAIWFFRKKIIFTALGAVTILICLPSLAQVFPMHFPKKAEKGEKTFSVMTWNVLHTQDQEHTDIAGNRAIDYILSSGADIVCLQELLYLDGRDIPGYSSAMEAALKKAYPYTCTTSWTSDIKILSKYPVKLLSGRPEDQTGRKRRFFVFEFNIGGHRLYLANVHLMSYSLTSEDREIIEHIRGINSAKESTRKFKASVYSKLKAAFRLRAENAAALREEVSDLEGPLIICGDFNDVPTSWVYRTIRGDDFKDAHQQTAFWPTFTYNAHCFYFHIDQILYRGPLEALTWKRGDIRTSDHYPQIATFAFTDNRQALRGYLPSTLLTH